MSSSTQLGDRGNVSRGSDSAAQRRMDIFAQTPDMSSSAENLTQDQKYLLRHTPRQDPPGEEGQQRYTIDTYRLISESMSNDSVGNGNGGQPTVIIHGGGEQSARASRYTVSAPMYSKASPPPPPPPYTTSAGDSRVGNWPRLPPSYHQVTGLKRDDVSLVSSVNYLNTSVTSGSGGLNLNQSFSGYASSSSGTETANHAGTGMMISGTNGGGDSLNSSTQSGISSKTPLGSVGALDSSMNSGNLNTSIHEISGIPGHYLDQSEVLKHLAKEVRRPVIIGSESSSSSVGEHSNSGSLNRQLQQLGITPASVSSSKRSDSSNSNSTFNLDLSTKKMLESHGINLEDLGLGASPLLLPPPEYQQQASSSSSYGLYFPAREQLRRTTPSKSSTEKLSSSQPDLTSASGEDKSEQLLELLKRENTALRKEISSYHSKVGRLRKLETELQKLYKSHEALALASERRERLERTAREKLTEELRKAHDLNRQLSGGPGHLRGTSVGPDGKSVVGAGTPGQAQRDLRKDLQKRDGLIGQLIAKNKELVSIKEQQSVELEAQRATLQEQRQHIDMLDSVLTSCQSKVNRLEEENRKLQLHVDKVPRLQQQLATLSEGSEKREAKEKAYREKLEKEIQELRKGVGGRGGEYGGGEGSSEVEIVRAKLNEAERKIQSLERDLSKWEERSNEEIAMRQIAVDAAALPRDARIQELAKEKAQVLEETMAKNNEIDQLRNLVSQQANRITDLELKLTEMIQHEMNLASASSAGVVSTPGGGYVTVNASYTSPGATPMSVSHSRGASIISIGGEQAAALGGGEGGAPPPPSPSGPRASAARDPTPSPRHQPMLRDDGPQFFSTPRNLMGGPRPFSPSALPGSASQDGETSFWMV